MKGQVIFLTVTVVLALLAFVACEDHKMITPNHSSKLINDFYLNKMKENMKTKARLANSRVKRDDIDWIERPYPQDIYLMRKAGTPLPGYERPGYDRYGNRLGDIGGERTVVAKPGWDAKPKDYSYLNTKGIHLRFPIDYLLHGIRPGQPIWLVGPRPTDPPRPSPYANYSLPDKK